MGYPQQLVLRHLELETVDPGDSPGFWDNSGQECGLHLGTLSGLIPEFGKAIDYSFNADHKCSPRQSLLSPQPAQLGPSRA